MNVVLTVEISHTGSTVNPLTESFTVELHDCSLMPDPIDTQFVVFANDQTSETRQFIDISTYTVCYPEDKKFFWQVPDSTDDVASTEFTYVDDGSLTFTTPTDPSTFAKGEQWIDQKVGTTVLTSFPFVYCYIDENPGGQVYADPLRIHSDNYFVDEIPTVLSIPLYAFDSYTVSTTYCGNRVFSTSSSDTTITEYGGTDVTLDVTDPASLASGTYPVTI